MDPDLKERNRVSTPVKSNKNITSKKKRKSHKK